MLHYVSDDNYRNENEHMQEGEEDATATAALVDV